MSARTITIVGFAVIWSAALAVHLRSQVKGSRLASCNDLLRARRIGRAGRVATFAGWFWLGFHLLAR